MYTVQPKVVLTLGIFRFKVIYFFRFCGTILFTLFRQEISMEKREEGGQESSLHFED